MRLLFFIAEFYRLQGSQRSLLSLLRRLPERSVDPIVVFPGKGRCSEAYRSHGLNVIVLPAPDVLNVADKALLKVSPLETAKLLATQVLPFSRSLARLVNELKIDILHFNTPRSILLGGFSTVLSRRPSVLHVRGQMHVLGRIHRLVSQLIPSRMILVSEALRSHIYRVFRHKCQTIYTGISESDIPGGTGTKTNSVDLPFERNGRPIVCTSAAVCPFKGYHHLIEAAHILSQRGMESPIFLAIGEQTDESYYTYLQSLLKKYNLTNFHFLGWKDNMIDYYKCADIIILPSVETERQRINGREVEIKGNEGLPRVVLEAMFLGKPLIASRVAGTVEQIEDGRSGILVQPGNPEELAQAMEKLLHNAELKKEMGRQAKAVAQARFSNERMVTETVNLFHDLMPG
ncbi:MAG: glycosyltransferase family 4 protein [Deltaproteobacteria bacterium]|nr:glycosyltransferase family 4 protein [Deltaproteobacteria bacterium]